MIENITYANKINFNPLNKICDITGGSSGIGAALIKELKIRKAKHIINRDIKYNSQKDVDFYKCDVGNNSEIEKTINKIYEKYNKIRIYIILL